MLKLFKPMMKSAEAHEIVYPEPVAWTCGDWTISCTKGEMLNTAAISTFQEHVKVHRVPDAFYGYNSVYLVNPRHDLAYRVTALDALRFCSFAERSKLPLFAPLKDATLDELMKSETEANRKSAAAGEAYNAINFIPPPILAKQSEYWMKKDFSAIKDFQKVEAISDWTYSTPYKGTVSYLSKTSVPHYHPPATATATKQQITVLPTDEAIPLHKLGKENPVLHFDELTFFEDDLDDLGFAHSLVRVRTMADSFYMLLRSYVRLDSMFVRIMDTRIYHAFGTNCILREFQYRENTYSELTKNGFAFTSEWTLSHNQADIIAPSLALRLKVLDKITF